MILNIINKSNLLILLAFLLGYSSFAFFFEKESPEKVEKELIPYLEDFRELTSPHYNEIILEYLKIHKKELKGKNVGECWLFTSTGGSRIYLDSKFWETSSPERREVLILHELGHCLCRLDHNYYEGTYDKSDLEEGETGNYKNGYLPDQCPVTLMHPVVLDSDCFKKHRELYRYELRLRCISSAARRKF